MKLLIAATMGLSLLWANVYAAESQTAITSTTMTQANTAVPPIDKNKAEGEAFLEKNKKKKE